MRNRDLHGTTIWNERLNKAVRKTEKVRNSFPNPESALNLICAFLMDFEKNVYKYPITSFISVQDTLNKMFEDGYPYT
ncbi:MAG: transposase [Spirochaetia bacterium]|nr:transposase [Spirochaetia bacterium]